MASPAPRKAADDLAALGLSWALRTGPGASSGALSLILADPDAGPALVGQVLGRIGTFVLSLLLDTDAPFPVARIKQQPEHTAYVEIRASSRSRLARRLGWRGGDAFRVSGESFGFHLSLLARVPHHDALWLWGAVTEALFSGTLTSLHPLLAVSRAPEGDVVVRLLPPEIP